MAERVISVKMPGSLVRELRKHTAGHHYLDLSEQIRSIVRQQCIKFGQPHQDIAQLRSSIEQQIKSANSQLKKEQILKELAKLLKEESQ